MTTTHTVHVEGMAPERQVCFCPHCNAMTEYTRPRASTFAHLVFLTPIAFLLGLALYDKSLIGLSGAAAFIGMFYIVKLISGHQRRQHQTKCATCNRVTQH